jgi:Ca2+/Na+ antiporter
MSMDVANGLMQDGNHWDWEFMRDVSLLFGVATCFIAVWVDIRCRRATEAQWHQDYAFWLYLFGAIMFWSSLSLHDSNNEWGKLAYCGINLALVFWGAAIGRRVFTVLGGLGVTLYLGHLSYQVFKDSLLFPFALSLLGLGLVLLGVWWQRHEVQVQSALSRWVPKGLRGS